MSLKKLAGQTAIYGISSVLGRMLYFLLVPLYTNLTGLISKAEYGTVTSVYAQIAILMVLFTYRLDMAYFRFGADEGEEQTAFRTALSSHLLTSLLLGIGFMLMVPLLAQWFHYEAYERLLYWGGAILILDTLSEVPKARLRLQNRPIRFAIVLLSGICVNLGLNLFFLLFCPWALEQESWQWLHPFINSVFEPGRAIEYIFISNVAGSLVSFALLLPQWIDFRFSLPAAYWRKMMNYASPLIIVGISFVINETLDRTMIPLIGQGTPEERDAALGVYGANYKLAMFITLFTQAFRYGAEPFFFQQRHESDANKQYARVARYFTLAAVFGFLTVSLMLPLFRMINFIGPEYWEGMHVVPILLVANLLLGVYYNFSVWYKLIDKTSWGAAISVSGALITIVLNLWWIPIYSYTGSAWATLICYAFMCVATYLLGQRLHAIPYNIRRMLEYLFSALLVYGVSLLLPPMSDVLLLLIHSGLILLWLGYIWWRERGIFQITKSRA